MISPEKKAENEKREPLLGGEAALSRLKENLIKTSPQKEERKDTSPFKGRPYFPTKEYDIWLESAEAFKATGLSKKERLKFGHYISNPELVGKFFEKAKREPENINDELELGKWGKFRKLRELSSEDRKKVKKIYKGYMKDSLGNKF